MKHVLIQIELDALYPVLWTMVGVALSGHVRIQRAKLPILD